MLMLTLYIDHLCLLCQFTNLWNLRKIILKRELYEVSGCRKIVIRKKRTSIFRRKWDQMMSLNWIVFQAYKKKKGQWENVED